MATSDNYRDVTINFTVVPKEVHDSHYDPKTQIYYPILTKGGVFSGLQELSQIDDIDFFELISFSGNVYKDRSLTSSHPVRDHVFKHGYTTVRKPGSSGYYKDFEDVKNILFVPEPYNNGWFRLLTMSFDLDQRADEKTATPDDPLIATGRFIKLNEWLYNYMVLDFYLIGNKLYYAFDFDWTFPKYRKNANVKKFLNTECTFTATFRFWINKTIQEPDFPVPIPTPGPEEEEEEEEETKPDVANDVLPSADILDNYAIRITSETASLVTQHVVSDVLTLQKPLIFGEIVKDKNYDIYYSGDSNPGLIIRIHAVGNVEGLKIVNIDTNEKISISDDRLLELTGSKIKAGDTIILNTNSANKSLKLLRDAKYTNILNVLEKPFAWFKLSKGSNHFGYSTTSGADNIKFTVEFENLYEGV